MEPSRSKGNTIERIIAVAEQEFSSKGFDGANIENVAREAGVTKQLVYHYFKTKDQLYRATLENVSQGMVVLTDLESYQCLTPQAAIARLVNSIIDEFVAHPSYTALTLDQALHQGEHITQSSLFIPTMRSLISDVLEPILQRGAEQKIFKSGLNADTTFWMIFHLASACFLNGKIMSETSDIPYTSEQGITLWRGSTVDFILSALRRCD